MDGSVRRTRDVRTKFRLKKGHGSSRKKRGKMPMSHVETRGETKKVLSLLPWRNCLTEGVGDAAYQSFSASCLQDL